MSAAVYKAKWWRSLFCSKGTEAKYCDDFDEKSRVKIDKMMKTFNKIGNINIHAQ